MAEVTDAFNHMLAILGGNTASGELPIYHSDPKINKDIKKSVEQLQLHAQKYNDFLEDEILKPDQEVEIELFREPSTELLTELVGMGDRFRLEGARAADVGSFPNWVTVENLAKAHELGAVLVVMKDPNAEGNPPVGFGQYLPPEAVKKQFPEFHEFYGKDYGFIKILFSDPFTGTSGSNVAGVTAMKCLARMDKADVGWWVEGNNERALVAHTVHGGPRGAVRMVSYDEEGKPSIRYDWSWNLDKDLDTRAERIRFAKAFYAGTLDEESLGDKHAVAKLESRHLYLKELSNIRSVIDKPGALIELSHNAMQDLLKDFVDPKTITLAYDRLQESELEALYVLESAGITNQGAIMRNARTVEKDLKKHGVDCEPLVFPDE